MMALRRGGRRLVLIASALALVAAACSDSGTTTSNGASVRPFAEVQDSELAFEIDPDVPGRAVFHVTTTIPMICSAVFPIGSEELSVSADGGPSGDEAATATDPRASGENLALDATVSDVSSEFSDDFSAQAAIDGDLGTEWSTAGDGDDAFIELDLGAPRTIVGVEFVTRTMADDSATTSTFTVVADGEELGPFEAATLRTSRVTALDGVVTSQVVRFEVDSSSGGNTGAVEVRVFGPPPEPVTVTTDSVRPR